MLNWCIEVVAGDVVASLIAAGFAGMDAASIAGHIKTKFSLAPVDRCPEIPLLPFATGHAMVHCDHDLLDLGEARVSREGSQPAYERGAECPADRARTPVRISVDSHELRPCVVRLDVRVFHTDEEYAEACRHSFCPMPMVLVLLASPVAKDAGCLAVVRLDLRAVAGVAAATCWKVHLW